MFYKWKVSSILAEWGMAKLFCMTIPDAYNLV